MLIYCVKAIKDGSINGWVYSRPLGKWAAHSVRYEPLISILRRRRLDCSFRSFLLTDVFVVTPKLPFSRMLHIMIASHHVYIFRGRKVIEHYCIRCISTSPYSLSGLITITIRGGALPSMLICEKCEKIKARNKVANTEDCRPAPRV